MSQDRQSLIGCQTFSTESAEEPDNDQGRAIADYVGPAALRAVELSEVEFAATPEAC